MPETVTVPRIEDLPPQADGISIIIDVLRFTTTAVCALQQGAEYVRPFNDRESALAFREENENVLLAGETDSRRIPGFDMNNSPSGMLERDLNGYRIGAMTSNGTRALAKAGEHETYLGSTVNARALADHLKGRDGQILLIAAGHNGVIADEDLVGAQLIESHLADRETDQEQLRSWQERVGSSDHAGSLREMGHDDDIDVAQDIDSIDIVPVLQDGVIRAIEHRQQHT
jgi:2-phosphosulfolactate phosphatase